MSSKTALDMTPSMWKRYRPFRLDKGQKSSQPSIAEAHKVAKSIAEGLISRFGSTKVVLFGSLARGNFNLWSDIDIAVWGISPTDFCRAVAFASGYSSVWEVDIVDAEDCTKDLLDVILQEGIVL